MSQSRQCLRIYFSIQGDVRFISHHDLMRLFARAVRRAHLPVAMSEGYNPRPKLSFPAPLSVGFSGKREVMDVELHRWMKPAEAETRLEAELPEGMELKSVQSLPPKPNRKAEQFSYRIPLLEGHPLSNEKLDGLLAREEIIVERRRRKGVKTIDIRPFIKVLRLHNQRLHMLIAMTDKGTARPQEVLEALGCRSGLHYLESKIERTEVNLSPSL